MKDNNMDNCVFVKTFLMFLVVLGHACAFWTGTWFTRNPVLLSKGLNVLSQWLGTFHTFTFTLVSGYIFYYKIRKGDYQEYSAFINKKVKRLLVPYLFTMVIWVAPFTALFFRLSAQEMIRKFILCVNPAQLWFLWMLFDVFVIFYPIYMRFGNKHEVMWLICICLYCAGLIGNRILPNVFCIWTAFRYIIFFWVGMEIRRKEEIRYSIVQREIPVLALALIHLLLFIMVQYYNQSSGVFSYFILGLVEFLCSIVGAYTAFELLSKLANKVSWKQSRGFYHYAGIAMPIYLFHQQIIYLVIIAINGKVNPWLHAAANLLFAIYGSALISMLLMKYRITRVLIGEKK